MRRLLAAVAALVALAPIGLADAADFGTPQPVFSNRWIASRATAQLPDGSAYAVAQIVTSRDHSQLQLAWRPAGRAFEPALRLSRGGSVRFRGRYGVNREPSGLAVTASGFGAVAWIEGGRAMAVVRRPGREPAPAETLAPAIGAVTATTPSGDVLVVFRTVDGVLRAAVRPHDADHFGVPRTLASYTRNLDTLSMRARDDDFLLLWSECTTRRRPARCPRFHTSGAVLSADGRAVTTRTLSVAPVLADRQQLLVGASGDALALWSAFGGDDPVRVARVDAGGRGFGRPLMLSRPRSAASAVAAASGRAGGFAAWIERDDDGDSRVVGAELRADATVGAPITLSRKRDEIVAPLVRVGDDGSVAVAWRLGMRTSGKPATWELRSRPRDGRFAATATLSAVEQLDFAVDPDGAVVALVRVAERDDDPGPTCIWQSDLLSGVWPAGSAPRLALLDRCVVSASPTLAVNNSGEALAVWTRDLDTAPPDRWLRYALRSPGGGFGAVLTSGGVSTTFAETALAANGDAIAFLDSGADTGPPLYATLADNLFTGP